MPMGDVTPESVHVDELIRRETRIGELLAEVDQERRDRLYFKAERNRLLTEVERLRVELHAAKAAAKGYHDLDEANRAKVERLRWEGQTSDDYHVETIKGLEAEVERLREALDWIYAEPEDPIKVQKRAREALDG